MLRRLALILALAPMPATAEEITDRRWELLAIDGVVFDAAATLTIAADGTVTGKAPCNGWSATNRADLPALALGPIRATRMACNQLEREQAFFALLPLMTELRLEGSRNLILSGPEGRTMEFVPMVMNSLTGCLTCPPQD